MNQSWGKSRRSIARTLVTTLFLSLLTFGFESYFSSTPAFATSIGSSQCTSDFTPSTYVVEVTQANYCIMKVTSGSTTWTPPTGVLSFYVLAVGGGGGGGNNAGGGGAGGGIAYGKFTLANSVSVSITVGAGGDGGVTPDGATMDGKVGAASTVSVNSGIGTITANGGAGGETHWATNACGGSGSPTVNVAGGTTSGSGTWNSITSATGGSGGGWAPSGSNGGAGGAGTSINITGSAISYGGGGGGGAWNASGGAGGSGGGGNGGGSGTAGANGTANTGGGGGGGGDGCKNGGAGGSGVVIIKWIPVPTLAPASSTTTFFNRAGSFSGTVTSSTTLTRSYQWMVSSNSGTSYANVSDGSGATTTSYTSATISSTTSSNLYRMAATDSDTAISTTGYSAGVSASTVPLPGGETDSALVLNGTNQFAWAADDNTLDIDNAFTFQAWVKPSSINSGVWNIVFGKYGSFQIGISTTGKWAYAFAGATDINGASTSVLAVVDEWHHIAFTRAASANTLYFYYDGQLAGTYTGNTVPTGALTNSAGIFSVGALRASSSASEKHFAGSIDQVAIYSTVRSEPTIKEDMNSYLNISDSNLKLYYDFNEWSGSSVFNRIVGASPNSDLTVVGASFSDVKITDTTTLPAYTIVKFSRSYLTNLGGWKVPANIPASSILSVAGGGAGGSRVGGGGGAGGYVYRPRTQLTGGSIETITIGVGGVGIDNYAGRNGGDSILGARIRTIGGGGGGASNGNNGNLERPGRSGGSGGGTGDTTGNGASIQTTSPGSSDGLGNAGGLGTANGDWSSGGGGGAGASGFAGTDATYPGWGGTGVANSIAGDPLCYAAGGGGGVYSNTPSSSRNNGGRCSGTAATGGAGSIGVQVGNNGVANTGSGGGGSGFADNSLNYDKAGGNGGSGVIIIRWITASIPTYTKPTNAYLNLGMTESFSVNIASDSATVNLTRTFRWESSTTGANGPFALIKQGTGASNASFSWVPTDTSTSGSNYLYRVIVTDSDTAGLFIVDTSTAVYAVINRALSVSGTSGIGKTINVSKSETFTITLGTPSYRTTLTANNSGITLDTSTATSPVIRIADTMTVGTYYETLTVTDSVSASVVTPLTIVVAAPPNLVNSDEVVSNKLIFNLDFANSASFDRNTRAINDLSGSKRAIALNGSPTFYDDNSGHMKLLGGSNQYVSATGFTTMSSWTIETYFKVDTAAYTCIANQGATSGSTRNFALCLDAGRTMYAGFFNGSAWTYRRTIEQVQLGAWTHVVARWDGTYNTATNGFKIWFNNTLTSTSDAVTNATSAPAATTSTLLISRDPLNGASAANISIGVVRIYSKALSDSEVAQNYNATKDRFLAANIDKTYPSQKYGNRLSESFTATSGYGNDAISYATGSKPGLSWTTNGTVTTLVASETLTATTHYDTITVTDSLGASTYLPIKMTVSKADTLTISMDTATTVVYNAAPITVYPKIYFKGLAGVDTLTASTRFTTLTYADSATVPTDVDTYTVIAANPVFTVGALSNYVAVVYETSTAKVTQANQNKLSINLYGAVAGSPFLIQTFGGSGDGLVTESVTAGSTATGCAVSNHVLSNTSPSTQQLTCNILVTKAASKNYKVETLTATVYFMLYANNMPTNQVGSGSTIGLNGINSVWIDPGATPTITGPGAGTYSNSGSATILITGSGFSLGPITVKFERNQLGSNITVASDTSMTVTIPSGARTGVFSVTNRNGTEYSSFVITIS